MRPNIPPIYGKDQLVPLLFLSLLAAIVPAVLTAYQATRSFVEIDAQVTGTTRAQLFNDCGEGFLAVEYGSINIPAVPGPQVLRFEVSRRSQSFLFRPIGEGSAVKILSAKILSGGEKRAGLIPAEGIKPLSQEGDPALALGNSGVGVSPLALRSVFIIKPPASLRPQPVLRDIAASVLKALAGWFLGAFFILSLGSMAWRRAAAPLWGRLAGQPALNPLRSSRAATVLIGLGVFCVILGARSWLIHRFGSSIPFADSWDAEIMKLYKPYFDGTLKLTALFSPHNEHRIFFTRVLALGLTVLKGQWDGKLQMEAIAVIFSCFACGLFLLYAKAMRGRYLAAIGLFIAFIFALPFDWENMLTGFQAHFFLIGFAPAAIWLMEHHAPFGLKWNIGCLLCLCSLFTVASGMLVPLAVAGTLLLGAVRAGHDRLAFLKSRWPTIAVCAGIFAAGLLLMPVTGAHQGYKARSILEFIAAFAKCLAWPNPLVPWWAPLNWLPFAALAAAFVRGYFRDDRGVRFTIGLGLLVLLQSAAMAFARGAGAPPPVSRYMQILSLGLLVNFCSLLFFLTELDGLSSVVRARLLRSAVLWVWVPVNFAGLCLLSDFSLLRQLPMMDDCQQAQKANLEAFLATDDIAYLKGKPLRDIPYTDPDKLAAMLREPVLRRILGRKDR